MTPALLRRVAFRHDCFLVDMRSPGALAAARVVEGVTTREVTAAEVDRVLDLRDEIAAAEFRRLHAAGHLGVYAWREGRVVGHLWAILCREATCRYWGGVDFVRGEALFAWGHVAPELRGRGIYQAIVHELTRLVFARGGVERIVVDLPADSPELLPSFVKMGFRSVGRLRYTNVLGMLVRRRFEPSA